MIRYIVLFLSTIRTSYGMRRLPIDLEIGDSSLHGRRLGDEVDQPHNDTPKILQQSPRHTDSTPDPDTHLVTSLPLLPDDKFPTKHWAGHLPAAGDGSDKKIFYWLFEPGQETAGNNNPGEIPLILWLNGGPGCSSMDGLWLENGPFRLNSEGGKWNIDVNPHSWHNAAWTLYVDQPVG